MSDFSVASQPSYHLPNDDDYDYQYSPPILPAFMDDVHTEYCEATPVISRLVSSSLSGIEMTAETIKEADIQDDLVRLPTFQTVISSSLLLRILPYSSTETKTARYRRHAGPTKQMNPAGG